MIPSALVLLALALAALRTWRLAALDTLPILVTARDRIVGYHGTFAGEPLLSRPLLAEWLQCPWCSGLWISTGWYVAWLAEPTWAVYAAAPFAISAAVGAIAHNLADA